MPADISNHLAVISKLGALMETWPGEFVDASLLPLPKDELKVALREVWRVVPDQRMKQSIEVSYLHLRHFQDGVGPAPVCFAPRPEAPANEQVDQMGLWLDWMHKTADEADALKAELDALKASDSTTR
jgi:hypothetical protein